jgi:hypothetical protein
MVDIAALRLLLMALAGRWNDQRQEAVAYLIDENRILRAQLRGRRLRLTDEDRRRLARRGQRLGRRLLSQVATIVSPDTILRWHRQLIARRHHGEFGVEAQALPSRPSSRGAIEATSCCISSFRSRCGSATRRMPTPGSANILRSTTVRTSGNDNCSRNHHTEVAWLGDVHAVSRATCLWFPESRSTRCRRRGTPHRSPRRPAQIHAPARASQRQTAQSRSPRDRCCR